MAREAVSKQRGGTLTISRLAASHNLSRSTLLYYDRLGLLRAERQSAAGYRLYGAGRSGAAGENRRAPIRRTAAGDSKART